MRQVHFFHGSCEQFLLCSLTWSTPLILIDFNSSIDVWCAPALFVQKLITVSKLRSLHFSSSKYHLLQNWTLKEILMMCECPLYKKCLLASNCIHFTCGSVITVLSSHDCTNKKWIFQVYNLCVFGQFCWQFVIVWKIKLILDRLKKVNYVPC